MLDIIKKTVNGAEYTFYNSSRGNRSGFVHETELHRNGYFMGQNKIQYYNRTWESYEYQSAMKGLVSELLKERKKEYETVWKDNHKIKRLTAEKRKIMEESFQNDTPKDYAEMKELYEML